MEVLPPTKLHIIKITGTRSITSITSVLQAAERETSMSCTINDTSILQTRFLLPDCSQRISTYRPTFQPSFSEGFFNRAFGEIFRGFGGRMFSLLEVREHTHKKSSLNLGIARKGGGGFRACPN